MYEGFCLVLSRIQTDEAEAMTAKESQGSNVRATNTNGRVWRVVAESKLRDKAIVCSGIETV